MDPTQTPNRSEAERSLSIAAKLLAARDLVGSKRFANLALDADPNLSDDRPDQILAVADVLLSSQRRINHHHLDHYSILQLPHPSPNDPDSSNNLLKCHYRRLSLLLHPDRNRLPGADSAFKLIADAYSVLSDPRKRSLFDAELKISDNLTGPTSDPEPEPSFWTLCPSCCHVHQYARAHQNKTLRCQNCRRAFHAAELQTLPTLVPGTDMYYATWGFYPLGFANPDSTDWTPFDSVQPSAADGPAVVSAGRNKKKTTARKKVVARPKHRGLFGNHENVGDPAELKEDGVGEEKGGVVEEEARGININEAAKGVGEEDIDMMIDLDATDVMFGNLHNLPFLS